MKLFGVVFLSLIITIFADDTGLGTTTTTERTSYFSWLIPNVANIMKQQVTFGESAINKGLQAGNEMARFGANTVGSMSDMVLSGKQNLINRTAEFTKNAINGGLRRGDEMLDSVSSLVSNIPIFGEFVNASTNMVSSVMNTAGRLATGGVHKVSSLKHAKLNMVNNTVQQAVVLIKNLASAGTRTAERAVSTGAGVMQGAINRLDKMFTGVRNSMSSIFSY